MDVNQRGRVNAALNHRIRDIEALSSIPVVYGDSGQPNLSFVVGGG